MNIQRATWGNDPAGVPVEGFTLTNGSGMSVTVLSWGALIQAIRVPDRHGNVGDVVLGFDTLAPYLVRHPNFGVTAGRVANRIANARFTLDGTAYTLVANQPPNSLHGGAIGFARRNWSAEADGHTVRMTYLSPDGEEGYPGTLQASVTYSLDDENGLSIVFAATTDRPTVVNLTNHGYFNLAGTGDVLEHELAVFADAFLPVAPGSIPTGEIRPVEGTIFDLRSPVSIRSRLESDEPQLALVNNGIDHNYVLGPSGPMKHAARVVEPRTGRVLDVHATQPGVQVYTGNNLDGTVHGKAGAPAVKYAGLCLETQHFPDAPNQPSFPTIVLRPNDNYRHTAVYRFSTH